jgi:NTP pyrophosphatase (non-canonical NTP hydrolase)
MNTIKELQKEIHKISKSKEFWEDQGITLSVLKSKDCHLSYYHTKHYIISQKLMLVVAELGEALEALRNNRRSNNKIKYVPELQDKFGMTIKYSVTGFEKDIKDTFEDELADSVIRILDLAEWLGIDLETHIKLKMEYNKTRPIKHNKEF